MARRRSNTGAVSLGFLAVGAALTVVLRLGAHWTWLASAALAMSVVALVAYGVDKSAARRKGRRIPESTLHLLALLGGAPGALVGMYAFRHKTAKLSFQLVFWGIALGQVALVLWLWGRLG